MQDDQVWRATEVEHQDCKYMFNYVQDKVKEVESDVDQLDVPLLSDLT